MSSQRYRKEFAEAVLRTVGESYLLPSDIQLLGKYNPYRNDDTYKQLFQAFMNKFADTDGIIDLTNVKGQCLNFHYQMASVIKQQFEVSSFLTIGYVTFDNQDFFKFDTISHKLLRTLQDTNKRVLDIHVWLTLPSYEIIDLTLMAHIWYVNATPMQQVAHKKLIMFPYYFGSADYLSSDEKITYHPKYVGVDVLRKNGLFNTY